MNQKGIRYGGLAAAIVVGFAVKAVIQPSAKSFWEGFSPQRAAQTSGQTVQKIESDAQAHHPGLPAYEAIRQEAIAQVSADLRNTPELQRSRAAANQFLGYYYSNTTVYTEICQAEGVDVGPYVQAFQNEHANVLQRAHKIMAEAGVTPEQFNAMMANAEPSIKPVLTQRLRGLAASINGTSVRDGCQYISDNGKALAPGQSISTVNPDVYKALVQD